MTISDKLRNLRDRWLERRRLRQLAKDIRILRLLLCKIEEESQQQLRLLYRINSLETGMTLLNSQACNLSQEEKMEHTQAGLENLSSLKESLLVSEDTETMTALEDIQMTSRFLITRLRSAES